VKASIGELSIDFPNKQRIKPELKPSSGEIHEVSPAKCFDESAIFFSIGMNFMMVENHARDLVLPRASLAFFEILPGERYRGLEVMVGFDRSRLEQLLNCLSNQTPVS